MPFQPVSLVLNCNKPRQSVLVNQKPSMKQKDNSKIDCPLCARKFKARGMAMHFRVAHPKQLETFKNHWKNRPKQPESPVLAVSEPHVVAPPVIKRPIALPLNCCPLCGQDIRKYLIAGYMPNP